MMDIEKIAAEYGVDIPIYKTEQEQLHGIDGDNISGINQNPYNLFYIKNPTEKVVLEAIKLEGSIIKWIDNPTEKMKKLAIIYYPNNIIHIKNPSDTLKLMAIKCALHYNYEQYIDPKIIDNISEDLKMKIIRKDIRLLRLFKNPSNNMLSYCLKTNHLGILESVHKIPEAIQLDLIRRDWWYFIIINKPTSRTKWLAVKACGDNIKFVKNPSERLQLEAAKTCSPLCANILTSEKALRKLCERLVTEKVMKS